MLQSMGLQRVDIKLSDSTTKISENTFHFKISTWLWLFSYFGHHAAHGILVPHPGTEPTPSALEIHNLNHWTAKEVL